MKIALAIEGSNTRGMGHVFRSLLYVQYLKSHNIDFVYLINDDSKTIDVLKKNTKDIDNSIIIQNDYEKALKYFKENNIKFDIIFLDPPYKDGLINPSITKILEYDLLNSNGIIVCEYEVEEISCELELIKEKKYGSKYIKIYKN